MTNHTTKGTSVHWAAEMHAQEYRDGNLSRREFMARVTALGVAAPVAYGMIGLQSPAARSGAAARRYHPLSDGSPRPQRPTHL